ncbi:uncharacterized protein BO96DRAFT_325258 [Aspergillus niger CBS 101883]|uniref:Uncharacterized protein n=1 Tax=Aspergillus niger ATCC 13496 TaxID=1353008 RepID=A0A370BM73_ASPNG|nr:uncharacterized protein BO96DRAFT_325258 [Aspergillus niger CBS 101883]PYH61754.1 hypothetical protein BO96DRAFT_325258 [Aspergillus niger CBS 101883]RDH14191.1 hypothetical protein M747DRAFT_300258 [Aspergillus niger ATCC 13496]
MDDLVKFLPKAQWRERGQHTSICNDSENLEPILVKCVSEIPLSLEGFGLQVWKTTGNTRILEKAAYIIPVSIIEGTPRILDGPQLVPGSDPFYFEDQAIISGSLYYILAKPPTFKFPGNGTGS